MVYLAFHSKMKKFCMEPGLFTRYEHPALIYIMKVSKFKCSHNHNTLLTSLQQLLILVHLELTGRAVLLSS